MTAQAHRHVTPLQRCMHQYSKGVVKCLHESALERAACMIMDEHMPTGKGSGWQPQLLLISDHAACWQAQQEMQSQQQELEHLKRQLENHTAIKVQQERTWQRRMDVQAAAHREQVLLYTMLARFPNSAVPHHGSDLSGPCAERAQLHYGSLCCGRDVTGHWLTCACHFCILAHSQPCLLSCKRAYLAYQSGKHKLLRRHNIVQTPEVLGCLMQEEQLRQQLGYPIKEHDSTREQHAQLAAEVQDLKRLHEEAVHRLQAEHNAEVENVRTGMRGVLKAEMEAAISLHHHVRPLLPF